MSRTTIKHEIQVSRTTDHDEALAAAVESLRGHYDIAEITGFHANRQSEYWYVSVEAEASE